MKDNKHFLNTALAAVFGLALLIMMLIRAFAPSMVLPRFDIPNFVLVSVVALLLDHYVTKGAKPIYPMVLILSALTFGLLPFAASFATGWQALKLAAVGGVVFTITTLLFRSIQERLSTGPVAKAAPFFSALGLYLAAQCFAGILL